MSVTDGSLTTDGAQQTVRIAGTVTTVSGGGGAASVVQIADGSNPANKVSVSGGSMSVIPTQATAANLKALVDQGGASALAGAWPIKLVDGSQNLASITNPANLTVGPALMVATGSQQAVTSLNAVATGNGATVDLGAARANITTVVVASAGTTAGTVALEVSHDGTNWFRSTTTISTTAPGVYQASLVGAFRYARSVITANITGGTVSSTIMGA